MCASSSGGAVMPARLRCATAVPSRALSRLEAALDKLGWRIEATTSTDNVLRDWWRWASRQREYATRAGSRFSEARRR